MAVSARVDVSGLDDIDEEYSDSLDESSENSSGSSPEITDDEEEIDSDEKQDDNQSGNSGWADAMASILKVSVPSKNFILSKAKKDADIKQKIVENEELDVEPDSKIDTNKDNSDKLKRKIIEPNVKESRNKVLKKQMWENMGRLKPDISEKEAERVLSRIATRGVVQLFNAVKQQQKAVENKLKESGNSEVKKDKILKSYSKSAFIDLLKGSAPGNNNNTSKLQKTDKTSESPSTWSVFRDDFMMGATMKDWDKDEDTVENDAPYKRNY